MILRLAYDYTPRENDDPFVGQAQKVLKAVGIALEPGSFLVDLLPIRKFRELYVEETIFCFNPTFTLVRYLPDWFPGAAFKRLAAQWNKDAEDMVSAPFAFVRAQQVQSIIRRFISTSSNRLIQEAGTPNQSFVSHTMQKELSDEEIIILKYAAGTLYGGMFKILPG
jgi:hypothetical protein